MKLTKVWSSLWIPSPVLLFSKELQRISAISGMYLLILSTEMPRSLWIAVIRQSTRLTKAGWYWHKLRFPNSIHKAGASISMGPCWTPNGSSVAGGCSRYHWCGASLHPLPFPVCPSGSFTRTAFQSLHKVTWDRHGSSPSTPSSAQLKGRYLTQVKAILYSLLGIWILSWGIERLKTSLIPSTWLYLPIFFSLWDGYRGFIFLGSQQPVFWPHYPASHPFSCTWYPPGTFLLT